MAWIIKRGAYWHATWNQDGKPVRKSTGIPIEEHGKSAKQLRRTAETQAEAMERLAKGRCTLDEAQDALRAVAVVNGMSKAVPSVVELLNSVPCDSTAVSGHRTDANLTPDDCRALVGHDSEKIERGYFHLSEEKERYVLQRLEAAVQ